MLKHGVSRSARYAPSWRPRRRRNPRGVEDEPGVSKSRPDSVRGLPMPVR